MSNGSASPYLGIAAFCEKVLDEKDNVLSAVRIIDRITIEPLEPITPETPAFLLQMIVLIKFVSLGIEGEHKLNLKLRNPSEEETDLISYPLILKAESAGFNFKAPFNLGVKEAGFYWMLVYFDDQFFTQIPLEVVFRQDKA